MLSRRLKFDLMTAVSLRFTRVQRLLINDKIYSNEIGRKIYIKNIYFCLFIRWVDHPSRWDDNLICVDLVPKVEHNGRLLGYKIFTLKLAP